MKSTSASALTNGRARAFRSTTSADQGELESGSTGKSRSTMLSTASIVVIAKAVKPIGYSSTHCQYC